MEEERNKKIEKIKKMIELDFKMDFLKDNECIKRLFSDEKETNLEIEMTKNILKEMTKNILKEIKSEYNQECKKGNQECKKGNQECEKGNQECKKGNQECEKCKSNSPIEKELKELQDLNKKLDDLKEEYKKEYPHLYALLGGEIFTKLIKKYENIENISIDKRLLEEHPLVREVESKYRNRVLRILSNKALIGIKLDKTLSVKKESDISCKTVVNLREEVEKAIRKMHKQEEAERKTEKEETEKPKRKTRRGGIKINKKRRKHAVRIS